MPGPGLSVLPPILPVEEQSKVEVHPLRIPGRWVDGRALAGATMNSITAEICDRGRAHAVYALTLTRTRSNQ